MPLARRQGVAGRAAQVFGHHLVQRLLVLRGGELLHQRDAPRVRDIGLHLAAQGACADAGQPVAKFGKTILIAKPAKLITETGQVTKDAVVHHADQAIQLQQGILQWGGREQNLGCVGQRILERLADHVAGLVDVAQAVRFIHHHQVPRHALEIIRLGLGKLIRADDDAATLLKR